MRKIYVGITVIFCVGLFLVAFGKSGYASKVFYNKADLLDGYDATVPYGTPAVFTVTPGGSYYFVWLVSGTPYVIQFGYSSTFTTPSYLPPNVYSVVCEWWKDPNDGRMHYTIYQDIINNCYFEGSQTFTWLVYSTEPTPTPTPSSSPTPTPSATPTPTPTSTPYPTPTPTPTSTPTPAPTIYYAVTCTVSPAYAGQVYINPSTPSFPSGSTVTLTPSAYSGYQFDHWQETSPYYGALYTNPLSFSIDNNYAFTAVFTPTPTPTPTPSPSTSPTPYDPYATPTPSPSPSPSPSPTLPSPAVTPPPASTPTPTPTQETTNQTINDAISFTGVIMMGASAVSFVFAYKKD